VGTLLAIAGLGLLAAWAFEQGLGGWTNAGGGDLEAFSPSSDAGADGDLAAWRVALVGCAVLAALGALVAFIGLRGTTGVATSARDALDQPPADAPSADANSA
jgi:hypothetical protein